MASDGVKGTGLDARDIALAAKGRVAIDTATPEICFVKMDRPAQGGATRTIMILHQRWVTPQGRRYWKSSKRA